MPRRSRSRASPGSEGGSRPAGRGEADREGRALLGPAHLGGRDRPLGVDRDRRLAERLEVLVGVADISLDGAGEELLRHAGEQAARQLVVDGHRLVRPPPPRRRPAPRGWVCCFFFVAPPPPRFRRPWVFSPGPPPRDPPPPPPQPRAG